MAIIPKLHHRRNGFPTAGIRWPDLGDLALFQSPFGKFFRHPDTPLPLFLPHRGFPRPIAIFGFGPFAGMIVLVLNFIGFAGELLAENVEAADMRPVEAIRAAGGGRMKQMILGVYPQVRPVWIGH